MASAGKTIICMDITTSWRWRGQENAAGIIRAERQLALGLLAHIPSSMVFCRFNKSTRSFHLLDPQTASQVLHGRSLISQRGGGAQQISWRRQRLMELKPLVKAVARRVVRVFPTSMQPYVRATLVLIRNLLRSIREVLRQTPDFLRSSAARCKMAGKGIRDRMLLMSRAESADRISGSVGPEFLNSDCIYLSGGLDWDDKDMALIWKLKKVRGFKVAVIIYDLIPIYYPQYTIEGYVPIFTRHFVEAMWAADRVFTISNASLRQIEQACGELGMPQPPGTVIHLGTEHIATDLRPHPMQDWTPVPGKFVLYVSMLEPRKNHDLMYRIWTRLAERDPERCVPLVFVGRVGWKISEFLSLVKNDPRTKDKIQLLTDISDSDLSWLYQNCRFTVFPSMFEGWGFALAESLGAGKYCIAADTGALPEVSMGLVNHLDPLDFAAWYREVKLLLSDDAELARRERAIRERYRPFTWSNATSEMLTGLNLINTGRRFESIQAAPVEAAVEGVVV